MTNSVMSPEDFLEHYGVKGMRWGVRKSEETKKSRLTGLEGPDEVVRTTKAGDTITLRRDPPGIFERLYGISPKFREIYNTGAAFSIIDKDGKKVGDAVVQKKSDEELYLSWVGVKRKARGRGYASAVLKAAEEYGSQQGFKRMVLEVPGRSPDARHIYEKMGFKVTQEADPNDSDDIWGGLTSMEYVFDNALVKHGTLDDDFSWLLDGIDKFIEESLREEEAYERSINMSQQAMSTEDFLEHYGVKGMRWGVRRGPSANRLAKYSQTTKNNAKVDPKKFTDNDRQSFRREVRAAKKGQGVAKADFTPEIVESQYAKEHPGQGYAKTRLSGRVTGSDFRNSQGQKVSEEFANAVLTKAVNEQTMAKQIAVGAIFAAAILAGTSGRR